MKKHEHLEGVHWKNSVTKVVELHWLQLPSQFREMMREATVHTSQLVNFIQSKTRNAVLQQYLKKYLKRSYEHRSLVFRHESDPEFSRILRSPAITTRTYFLFSWVALQKHQKLSCLVLKSLLLHIAQDYCLEVFLCCWCSASSPNWSFLLHLCSTPAANSNTAFSLQPEIQDASWAKPTPALNLL